MKAFLSLIFGTVLAKLFCGGGKKISPKQTIQKESFAFAG